MINSVNTNQWVQTNQLTNTKQQTKANQTAQTTEENTASSDMVEIGTTSLPSVVYSKKKFKEAGGFRHRSSQRASKQSHRKSAHTC
ncbi:hypothetical protein SDC9_191683 [bioreactor metagenome]|uniref:Uncharacterized protein n=1 Tax=bioreactor metagenome TaxID=1076179 RepID=A0A645I055_9ZZZZ